jgi:integrase
MAESTALPHRTAVRGRGTNGRGRTSQERTVPPHRDPLRVLLRRPTPSADKGHAERSISLHPQAADALRPLIDAARQQAAVLQFDPAAGRAVQHLFVRRGKLLSRAFLFDLALKTACTARPARPTGRPTVSAHRFRHTIGTQLAEGGARLQRIMTDLGYRTPAMSLIYASLSDPTRQTAVRRRPRQGRRPGRAPRRAVSR